MSIVKSFSVGNGDMFYIKHNSDNFTIIDSYLSDENKVRILRELQEQSNGKNIVRFISTHPDEDHICGLSFLHRHMNFMNFYCVKNATTKENETDDFKQYRALRDDTSKAFYLCKGCSRRWMNTTSEERTSAGLDVLWPDVNDKLYQGVLAAAARGDSPNDISIILRYRLDDGVKMVWMGDLGWEFMEEIKDKVQLGPIDILFAPHHGRLTGTVPLQWLEEMSPKLIVIGEAPSEHLNYYTGYNTITQNSAGDITFDCNSGETHVYVSDPLYSVDFLNNQYKGNTLGYYIGTLVHSRKAVAASA